MNDGARTLGDDRTLEEVGLDHADNFDYILSCCNNKTFPSQIYAYEYRMHCVEKAFRDLGFSPQDFITNSATIEVAMELIDQALVSRGITCQDWSEHEDDDRKGLYLYKGEEIAYFVALVRKSGDNFIVKSNVSFD